MTSPELSEFGVLIAQAQTSCQASPLDCAVIQTSISAIAQHFQTEMLPATDALNPAVLVEINKQLRLLKTDALFLRSAKQAISQDQRLQQIRDRLSLLDRYCEML
ncbi:MAG: hypothetical protein RLZZ511_1161 [Cyanobacteriota bacterium]|jgi:hypothetical protein